MRGRLWILVVGLLLTMVRMPGIAQEPDARTLLQAALKAMGGDNLKSHHVFRHDRICRRTRARTMPRRLTGRRNQITTYTRTIDYDAQILEADYTLTRRAPARVDLPAAATRRSSPTRSSASSGRNSSSAATSPGT